jgi:hypothetical protein
MQPAVSPQLPELTPGEKRLLAAHRAMDNRSRAYIEKLATAQAKRCPRRAAPSLRLVAGTAGGLPSIANERAK